MKKILVSRFSAMGDVAMIVPVLKNVLEQNPDVELTVISRPFFAPFFKNIPRLFFKPVNLKKEYKGVSGIYKLAQELKKEHFDAYADLHHVLRTQILRTFLTFSISSIASIDKGRKEKKALVQKNHKNKIALKNTFERYADVFRTLGFTVSLNPILHQEKHPLNSDLQKRILFDSTKKHLGIAPFAQHKGKMYPFKKIQSIVKKLAQNSHLQIYLFGGGEKEKRLLDEIAQCYTNSINLIGKITLEEELQLISHLDLMLSMDSANMHMASLVGTPVIPFWGATHPYAGFMGFGQSVKNSIQREDLNCRPCSVYGNKPCWRGDWACLEVDESIFIEKINQMINDT
ncbi:MAG: glycosyltransferase family 9 protein [Flavobacteriales bacterium]